MFYSAYRIACFIISGLLLAGVALAGGAQDKNELTVLQPDQPVERELVGGQRHHYQIQLQAGQSAQIEVEQRGINVLLNLYTMQGQHICWRDKVSGANGTERLIIVAETNTNYRLTISPQRSSAAKEISPGYYEVKLMGLQAATEADRRQFQSQNLWAEAMLLFNTNDPNKKESGVSKLEEWLRFDGGLDERREKANTLLTLASYYFRQRKEQQALEMRSQALQLARELKESRLEMNVLYGTGVMYGWLYDRQLELSYYQQSLQLAQQLGEKRFAATVLNQWAGVLALMAGSFNGAEPLKKRDNLPPQFAELLEKSRTLYRELNDPMEASPLALLALVHAQNGDRKTALEELERVHLLSQSMNQLDKTQMKVYRAHIHSVLGDYPQALELREQAYHEFLNIDPDGLANVLGGVAYELRQLGRLTEARQQMEEMIRIKESLYSRLSDPEHRTNVASNMASIYELYFDLLMRMHEQKPEQKY